MPTLAILLQTGMWAAYLVLVCMGLAMLLIPPIVALRKGHPTAAVLCFILTLSFGWTVLGFLLIVLYISNLPDMRDVERALQAEADAQARADAQVWRQHEQLARMEEELQALRAQVTPSPPAAPSNAKFCPNPKCGSICPRGMEKCWNCGLVFLDDSAPLDSAAQSSFVPDIPPDIPPFPTKAAAKKSPVKPALPHVSSHELRIECRACGKRFSGAKGKIQLFKKCPKCGAVPFDYKQLPAKS